MGRRPFSILCFHFTGFDEYMMVERPKVSVCMIAYNVEKYIGEAIEGVLKQETCFEIELIISNDNSIDRTEDIVLSYLENHPRGNWIKYFRQEKNLGMMDNYLWTFEKCKGKFLSICDSDDYWTDPKKLQKQVDFLEQHEEFVLSFHDSFRIDHEGNVISKSIEQDLKRNLTFKDLTKLRLGIPTASVVFKNDLGMKYPDEYINGKNHDTFLFFLLARFGDFHFQKEVHPSAYRIHSSGTWSSRSYTSKSLHSLETFINIRKVFPYEINLKRLVFEVRNDTLVYAFKEKEFWTFIKEYPKNLLLALLNWDYFKAFLALHKKVFQ